MTKYKNRAELALAAIDDSNAYVIKTVLTGNITALKKAEEELKKKTEGLAIYHGEVKGKTGLAISYDYSAAKIRTDYIVVFNTLYAIFKITGCNLGVEIMMNEPVLQDKKYWPCITVSFVDDSRVQDKLLVDNCLSMAVTIIEKARGTPFHSTQSGGTNNNPATILYSSQVKTHAQAMRVVETMYNDATRALGMYPGPLIGPYDDNARPGRG